MTFQGAADSGMLTALTGDPSGIDMTIDPRDEMLQFATGVTGATRAQFDYFRLGYELTRSIEQIADWAFPGERDTISVLEFACGYGRIVRHLVRSFPRENVTVSDIDADAVAFVTEQFGVAGKLSDARPRNITWPERYDLIVVPSLFSHLPHATFGPWLTTLSGLLTERGVLAFSVHDEVLMPHLDVSTGIHFTAFSEANGRLDGEEYGTAHVTEGYVAMQVVASTGRPDYGRVRRGFWDHQDLYLVVGQAQAPAVGYIPEPPIMGHVDEAERSEHAMRLVGWARAMRPGLALRVRIDDETVVDLDDFTERPDVASVRGEAFLDTGYDLTIPIQPDADGRLLIVEATAGDQRVCFYALPIVPFEPPSEPRTTAPRGRLSTLKRYLRGASKR